MKRLLSTTALALCVGFAAPAMADQRPGHFKGKPAETLSAAVVNFSDYNKQLATVLSSLRRYWPRTSSNRRTW